MDSRQKILFVPAIVAMTTKVKVINNLLAELNIYCALLKTQNDIRVAQQ